MLPTNPLGWVKLGGAVLGAAASMFLVYRIIDAIGDHFSEFDRLKEAEIILEGNVTTLENTLENNRIEYERKLREAERAASIVRREREAENDDNEFVRSVRDAIADAPETDNGSVAPVLSDAFARLREREETGSAPDSD